MPEKFYVQVEPVICKYCPTEHAAVSVQFGGTGAVMPTEEAERFANELYEASLQAQKNFSKRAA